MIQKDFEWWNFSKQTAMDFLNIVHITQNKIFYLKTIYVKTRSPANDGVGGFMAITATKAAQ